MRWRGVSAKGGLALLELGWPNELALALFDVSESNEREWRVD